MRRPYDFGAILLDMPRRHPARSLVKTTLERISAAVGRRPRGWLGPGLAESARTPEILHEAGVEYRQRLIDQFEQLNEEAAGRVMAVPLHPFLTGQAPYPLPARRPVLHRRA